VVGGVHRAVRAVLTYLGLIFVGGGLGMLVLPSMRRTPWVPSTVRWVADRWWVSLLVLGLGVAVPILLRVGRWVIAQFALRPGPTVRGVVRVRGPGEVAVR